MEESELDVVSQALFRAPPTPTNAALGVRQSNRPASTCHLLLGGPLATLSAGIRARPRQASGGSCHSGDLAARRPRTYR